jgi:hypothetical protein
MKSSDNEFMERISRDLEAWRIACQILGVNETADKAGLKKAYKQTAMQFHPDKNSDDADANKKFTLFKCAYQLLAEDKLWPVLLEEINSQPGVPCDDDKYKLDNSWGHFLWWRDRFFG